MATVTRLTPPTLPEVTGYVEAATADRLLGWAWAPAKPSIRAMIELRLGDEIIARAVADQPRPDLASNGVGDGRHAFEIAVPNDYRARIAELRVFARSGDGEALPIGAPPAAEGLSEQMAKLARGVDALVASQRLMHRNLQAALSSRSHGPAESEEQMTTLARMAEAQTALGEQLATVGTIHGPSGRALGGRYRCEDFRSTRARQDQCYRVLGPRTLRDGAAGCDRRARAIARRLIPATNRREIAMIIPGFFAFAQRIHG